jgi:jouberin
MNRAIGDRGLDKTNDNFRITRNDYALQKFQKLTPSGPTLDTPPLVNSITHTALLRDKMVWTSFPLKERMASTTLGLITCKSKQTFVDQITTAKPAPNLKELSDAKNRVFKITINETSQLELDPNLMHPYVKVHIVDLASGNYVQKSGQKSVVTLEENITIVDNKMNCTRKEIDYIPPFATNCCDLRIAGNARARWNYSKSV